MVKRKFKPQALEEEFEELHEADEASDQPNKTKLKAFPAGVYRTMIFIALLAGGRLIYDASKGGGTPDEHSPEEDARSFITYRHKLHPERVGAITDERVKNIENGALCLNNLLGYPKEQGANRADSFICQPGQSQPMKFVLQNNTQTYVWDKFFQKTVDAISAQKAQPDTKDTMEWFVWEDPAEFLGQPLACVKGKDNSCLRAWDGNDCLLLGPLAKVVNQANREMIKAGNGQMEPITCFRNDFEQIVAWSVYLYNFRTSEAAFGLRSRSDCRVSGRAPGRIFPGNNLHGMGLALDLANLPEAKEYLAKYGIACSSSPFEIIEEGHCAFGDKDLMPYLKK